MEKEGDSPIVRGVKTGCSSTWRVSASMVGIGREKEGRELATRAQSDRGKERRERGHEAEGGRAVGEEA